MESRTFHIGALLSVQTGILAIEIGELAKMLNFMTGDLIQTVSIPRALDETRPYLLEQHPWLANIEYDDIKGEQCLQKVIEYARIYGEWHEVIPMHPEDHIPTSRESLQNDIRESGRTDTDNFIFLPDDLDDQP